MQATAHLVLSIVGWFFLVAGLFVDVLSCVWASAARLGRSSKSPALLVPLVLYAMGLVALGGLFFEYAFFDLLLFAALHGALQFVVPAVVGLVGRLMRHG